MFKSHSIFLAGLAVVALGTVFFIYFFKPSSMPPVAPPLEKETPRPAPAALPTDAKKADGPTLRLKWNDQLFIVAENLPLNSYYRVVETIESSGRPGRLGKKFTVTLYPDIGRHYLLGHYDAGLEIAAEMLTTSLGQTACKAASGRDDLSAETFLVNDHEVTIQPILNYAPDSGPYGNPNPYTPELKELLLKIWRGLKVGACP